MAVVTRGCGERIAGGLYVVAPLGPNGSPVEEFIIDPPQVVSIESMGLSAIGTTIVPRSYLRPDGTQVSTHYVLDIVGKEHYPNVADFVEETRRFGLSRRIARTAEFSKLDANSRIVLIHERAHIENANEYQAARDPERFWCPRQIAHHINPAYRGMCAALWWEDITGGVSASEEGAPQGKLTWGSKMFHDLTGVQMHLQRENPRSVIRTMPSLIYRGMKRPEGVTPVYRYAAFATFPIGLIEAVRDPAGNTHIDAIERARASGIEVREVSE